MRSISLFTGAGGLDLGCEAAGFGTSVAVEHNETAVATLLANREAYFPLLSEDTILRDIVQTPPEAVLERAGVSPGEVDLVHGGPPCTPFSKSGYWLAYKRAGEDPKASLLDSFVDLVRAAQPKAFLMENVFALGYRNQNRAVFERFARGINAAGYSFDHSVLVAADYGVPQNRQRLICVGVRQDLLDVPTPFWRFPWPAPTHSGPHETRTGWDETLPRHKSTSKAFEGLDATANPPEPEEVVKGTYAEEFRAVPPGDNYLWWTAHRGHPEPRFKWRSRYWTFLLKLHPDRPSPTIQGQPGPWVGPFHWDNRRLRVAELKRLMEFPDDFEVIGSRRDQQLQLGNAVPRGSVRWSRTSSRMSFAGSAPWNGCRSPRSAAGACNLRCGGRTPAGVAESGSHDSPSLVAPGTRQQMSPIAIDKDRAVQILEAAVEDARAGPISEEWAARARRLDQKATTKTYIAALGTALLARATDDGIDPMSIQASKNAARAYSARSLCHEVLVPGSRKHGFDLGVTGREPLNNQPFFRYERIDKMARVRDAAGLRLLLAALREVDRLRAADAAMALAGFISVRTAVADGKRRATLLDVDLGVRQAVSAAHSFISEEADGGRRGQALVAGVLDLAFLEVRMGRVNDPSRRFPGDVQAMAGIQVVLAVEVRQKVVTPADAPAFSRVAADAGVVNAAVAALHPEQEPLDRAYLRRCAEDEHGVLLSMIESADELISSALLWSGRRTDADLRDLPHRILDRLHEIEASPTSLRRWLQLLSDVRG